MIQKNFVYFFLLVLLLDVCYSFMQHYHVALDGDLAAIVIPSEGYSQVLKDPFALQVLFHDSIYAAPNRFFVHEAMSVYFKTAPLLLQNFVGPISSVYAASAIAKTAIQVLIILLLAVCIGGYKNIFKKEFLVAAVLITPLFQTFGYNGLMGIIDKSITYTFSYALPHIFLLLFFFPFFKSIHHKEKLELNFIQKFLLLIIAVIIPFSAPIVAGFVAIVCPLILVVTGWKYFKETNQSPFLSRVFISINKIPSVFLFYFILITFLCLYSLYIGMNNAENFYKSIPFMERYQKLPRGLYSLFTQRLGFPLLVLMIAVNTYFLNKIKSDQEGKKILSIIKWIGIVAAIYIVLLPLGGYRDYRPNILRRDTLMPILLCLIFFYGISSCYLLNHISPNYKKVYVTFIIVFSILFTLADEPKFSHNDCERKALETIAQSKEKIILLNSDCTVLSWSKIYNPNDSELNSRLLEHWGIMKEKGLYYQK